MAVPNGGDGGFLAEHEERRLLSEKLSAITSSISHRQPLQDVLDAITQGAAELLGDEVVGLRLADPVDPSFVIVASHVGLEEGELSAIQRTPATEGAGGRAMVENRLVVIEDYARSQMGLEYFRARQLQAAMAAPVHEGEDAIGSLVVATYRVGRTYSQSEKDALVALADHASLALSDAKIVEEMREAQRSKDMFLAMVSHELKTPLTVIMGTLRMLDRHVENLDPQTQKEMLASAIERAQDLQRMIDQLLAGSREELADEPREVTLRELIEGSVSGFENTFRIRMRAAQSIVCRLPAGTVRRIVGILIENAIGHSPVGTPIRVEAEVDDEALLVWVENFGELPEDTSDLFEPFKRGDDSGAGVGLGLYIAARLATSIGASLDARGSGGVVRFELTIPDAQVITRTSPAR